MTTPTPVDAVRTAVAADIPPGPYSEYDLRQQWNAQAADGEDWDELESYEQLAWAQARAIAADRERTAQIAEPTRSPAAPPAPETPAEALAARPLLEQVAAMGDCVSANTVGQITAISARAAAWLRENPPGQPVAIEPRGCPAPGACSCVEPATSAPALPATAPGELAQWLEDHANHLQQMEAIGAIPESELALMLADSAGLIRQHEATTARDLRVQGFDVKRLSARLDELANYVTQGPDSVRRNFTMRVPAEPYHDADLVLSTAASLLRNWPTTPKGATPALPPVMVFDGGDGVCISAINPGRTLWVVRRLTGCDWERLCTDGRWWTEPPSPWDKGENLENSYWPSAEAAWAALLKYRAAEGVEA